MSLHAKPGSPYHWYDFTIAGTRYRGSTKQKSITLARQVEAKLIHDVTNGNASSSELRQKTPYLKDFISEFVNRVIPHCRAEKTGLYYTNGVRLLRLTTLVNRRMDQINADHISEALIPGGPSNRNNALRTLRRIFTYAVDIKVMSRAPRVDLARENERSRLLSAEEEKLMLGEGCTETLRTALIVILDSGMRPDEIKAMRWDDVDFVKRVVFVPRGKTLNAKRHLPMSSRMVDALKFRASNGSDFVFPSRLDPKNQPITRQALTVAFNKRRSELKLDRSIVLYSARHTFATDFLEHTGNVAKLKKALGHSSLKTTDRYLHPEIGEMAEVMDARNESRHNSGHSNLTVN